MNNLIKYLIATISVVISFFLLLDTFGYSQKTLKILGVDSGLVFLIGLIFIIFVRIKTEFKVFDFEKKLIFFIGIFSILITSVATFFDALTPPNTLYHLTRMNQYQIFMFSVLFGFLMILIQKNNWWQKNQNKIIGFTPYIVLYLLFLVDLFPFDVFEQIIKEDNIIEYLQFLVLFSGGVSCIKIFIKNTKLISPYILFLICGLVFIFVAGDEIAWGQRILGIESTEKIKELNRQEEITLHNLHIVEWTVQYIYFMIALFGLYGRIFFTKIKFLKKYEKLTPSKKFYGYFLLPIVFFSAQLVIKDGIWHTWSEVAELYLYSGIVLWILSLKDKISMLYFDHE